MRREFVPYCYRQRRRASISMCFSPLGRRWETLRTREINRSHRFIRLIAIYQRNIQLLEIRASNKLSYLSIMQGAPEMQGPWVNTHAEIGLEVIKMPMCHLIFCDGTQQTPSSPASGLSGLSLCSVTGVLSEWTDICSLLPQASHTTLWFVPK